MLGGARGCWTLDRVGARARFRATTGNCRWSLGVTPFEGHVVVHRPYGFDGRAQGKKDEGEDLSGHQ